MMKNCCIPSAGCSSSCVWVALGGQAAARSTVVPLDLRFTCVLAPHSHVTSHPLRGVYKPVTADQSSVVSPSTETRTRAGLVWPAEVRVKPSATIGRARCRAAGACGCVAGAKLHLRPPSVVTEDAHAFENIFGYARVSMLLPKSALEIRLDLTFAQIELPS
ncbi:hypothetical protein Y032_0017g3212 [Ancylostoma ceylanicum]|uniref:Uncharacterized protein n=1 Tax=Ancylostoma ceylanicum TaxID=53326 RepID=A0A016V5C7_9BILA|nr:hypothetical protein Y032_0017g3212 [Ancylostoma ceylanicum]